MINMLMHRLVEDMLGSYCLCSKVLMLNPRVGSIVLMSSPLNFFKIVVFPALSRPLYDSVKE